MAHKTDQQWNVIFITGAPRSGKTSYGEAELQLPSRKRYIAVDTFGDIPADKVFPKGTSLDEVNDYLSRIPPGEPFSVTIIPGDAEVGETVRKILKWSMVMRDVTVFVDEAARAMPLNGTHSDIIDAVREMGHFNVQLIVATTRSAQISRDVTAFAVKVFFYFDEPRDQQYAAAVLGKDLARQLGGLEPLHFIRKRGRLIEKGHVEWHGKRAVIVIESATLVGSVSAR